MVSGWEYRQWGGRAGAWWLAWGFLVHWSHRQGSLGSPGVEEQEVDRVERVEAEASGVGE